MSATACNGFIVVSIIASQVARKVAWCNTNHKVLSSFHTCKCVFHSSGINFFVPHWMVMWTVSETLQQRKLTSIVLMRFVSYFSLWVIPCTTLFINMISGCSSQVNHREKLLLELTTIKADLLIILKD